MIIILLLGGVALFWFVAISIGLIVVKAQNKAEKQKKYEEYLRNNNRCDHNWVREVSDSGYYDTCMICKKVR